MSTIDIDVATGKPLTAREQKKREAKEAARKQSEKHGEASRLSKALWKFKREIAWIGFFSLIANALLIAPAIYNLQVYDRVMGVSQRSHPCGAHRCAGDALWLCGNLRVVALAPDGAYGHSI